MQEELLMRVGEERPVRLPPVAGAADWRWEVNGMSSAVRVERMWTSRPYEEDEEDGAGHGAPPRAMVFRVHGVAPGSATIRFFAEGFAREVSVRVEA